MEIFSASSPTPQNPPDSSLRELAMDQPAEPPASSASDLVEHSCKTVPVFATTMK